MKKLTKILSVILTTALMLTMFVGVIPVGAEPGENAWGEINLPPVDDWADTDTGVMAITPDGALMFLSVFDGVDEWDIVVSDDGGFTWSDTSLTGLNDPDGAMSWGNVQLDFTPVDIVVSPNWPDDDTVYVGCLNGTVYRIPDAGEGDPVTLIPMVDSDGLDISTQGMCYDLDIWYDGTNNWIAAATDLDVFIIKDALFELWRDMEMETETDSGPWAWAVQVDFAPDFASSNLLWAIRADSSGELYLTSTVSPGQWGVHVAEVWFENQNSFFNQWSPFVDVAFPDTYDSDNPQLWVAVCDWSFPGEGNLYLVNAALMPGTSTAQPIFDNDVDLGSVEVSGYNILVKEFYGGNVHISNDGAGTFNEATRSPGSGNLYWGHLYMAPGAFDADEGVAYCTGLGIESAVSRTVNGGDTWHQISYIDTEIDELEDIAFAPMTASQPAFLLTEDEGPDVESLWYTADVAAEDVQWIRCGTEDTFGWNHMDNLEYALDGSGLIMFVVDGGDLEMHKSTDNGDTFMEWRDVPAGAGWVYDFIVADGVTIYAATDQGFWGTSAFGPPNLVTLPCGGRSVAVMDEMVAVGCSDGNVFLSDDGGATFGDGVDAGDGTAYVTFGPDGSLYAATAGSTVVVLDDDEFVDVEDSTEATATTPDGFVGIQASPDNTLYALSMGSDGDGGVTPGTVEVDDSHPNSMQILSITGFGHATVFFANNLPGNDIMPLSGTFVDGELLNVVASSLIWMTAGPALHGAIVVEGAESGAMGTVTIFINSGIAVGGPIADGSPMYVTGSLCFADVTAGTSDVTPAADAMLWRLLIGEEGNLWENASIDVNIVEGLWLTEGSNLLWTFSDPQNDEEDLGLWGLEDFLTGPVTLTAPADGETVAGFTSATLEWEELDTADGYDVGGDFDATTDETELDVSSLTDNTEYEWMVRANAPWQSRWSAAWTFTTADFVDAPSILVPLMGSQDYTTYPSFVWSSVSGADEYELEISANPDFSDAIVVTTTITQYTQMTALDFDHNYYWRVRATSSVGGVSAWTVGNFHTAIEAQPPVVVEENPPANITLTVPQPETPGYIWAIIAVGAILTIAVIVLIVRTRRVV